MHLTPIAYIHSCFPQKFGIPRQGVFADQTRARIVFEAPYHQTAWWEDLSQYSYIWIIFGFDAHYSHSAQAKVRPPRLGGNRYMSTFATRSSFRPNPLGLSAVRLLKIESNSLLIGGHDLKHMTPVFDIKPYIPLTDALHAPQTFVATAPSTKAVHWSNQAHEDYVNYTAEIHQLETQDQFCFKALIEQVIGQDPRPAYHDSQENTDRLYGVMLYQFNICFTVMPQGFMIQSLSKMS